MNALVIANRSIRTDADGRYNLGDLHIAAGSEPRHRPSRWLTNQKTQELVWEIETKAGKPALTTRKGGRHAGSFVCRELVYAYAMWISPAFQLKVIEAYDAMVAGTQATDIQGALRNPTTLRALLVEQVDERLMLEAKVAELAPAAAAMERLESAKGSYSLREAAKALRIGEQRLIEWLLTNRWCFRERERNRVQAFARAIQEGLLFHSMVLINHTDGRQSMTAQTKVSPKGMARLAKALARGHSVSLALPAPTSSNHRH